MIKNLDIQTTLNAMVCGEWTETKVALTADTEKAVKLAASTHRIFFNPTGTDVYVKLDNTATADQIGDSHLHPGWMLFDEFVSGMRGVDQDQDVYLHLKCASTKDIIVIER